jgi:predicted RNase H-like HicB family nuclease
VAIRVTVGHELLEQLDLEAARAGLSRAALIRHMLEDHLAADRARQSTPRTEKVTVAGREFTVRIERDRRWWIGSVEELPGCGSQGRTLAELREMIADAAESYLIVRGDIPDHAATPTSR